jgi:hypothetical protein
MDIRRSGRYPRARMRAVRRSTARAPSLGPERSHRLTPGRACRNARPDRGDDDRGSRDRADPSRSLAGCAGRSASGVGDRRSKWPRSRRDRERGSRRRARRSRARHLRTHEVAHVIAEPPGFLPVRRSCVYGPPPCARIRQSSRGVRSSPAGSRLSGARTARKRVGFAGISDASSKGMRGLITERDFEAAETEFPGIAELFRNLEQKPKTFLDLFERYIHCDQPLQCTAATVASERAL